MQKKTFLTMLKRHKVTLSAIVLSSLYMYLYSFINVDLFKLVVAGLAKIEEFQAEEAFLGIVFILIGFLIDKYINWKQREGRRKIEKENLFTMRSTMTTVHDVVNNFLNNLLFFRFEAEKSTNFDTETLKTFDDLISETSSKLREIDDLEKVIKRDLGSGVTGLVLPAKAHDKAA